MRSKSINTVRGLVKTMGERLPSCSSSSFHRKVVDAIPDELKEVLLPHVELIGQLTTLIRSYDKKVEALCDKYKETKRLRAIGGVGPLIALAFVLLIEDPKRFRRSRSAGPYLGLVPRQYESGESSPQLRITKAGNKYLRQLLIQGAHYILGMHGEDCDLRRFGEKMLRRAGPKGKKKAVVAVARKLAVVMHHLWSSGEDYDPFYSQSKRKRLTA